MPRQTRAGSGPQNPYAQQQLGVSMASSSMYPQQRLSMPDAYFAMPASSAPPSLQLAPPQLQPPPTSFDGYPSTVAPSGGLPPPHRPSSGAWTVTDDKQLMEARAQGLNWSQIKDTYFPSKTPNACRKRHERLAERRDADDWDNRKLQRLAREYMAMRKEIWGGLAARTGEKWSVVEQKCMSNGLKNLQSAARAATRHERLQSQSAGGGPLTGYDDDSGISGIGLTPVDELDASYSSPETSSSGGGPHSAASSTASAGYHQHHQQHPHHSHHHSHPAHLQAHHPHAHLQAMGGPNGPNSYLSTYGMPAAGGYHGHRYSSSVSSTASAGHAYAGGSSESSSSPYMRGQRLPSVDMGIGAIINRPGGGGRPV